MSSNKDIDLSVLQALTRGKLFIVSAPSGGGKGTLLRRVLKTVPNLSYSVSFTTRPPREDELHGRDYYFVTVEKFEKMRDDGEFLEYAIVHDNYYGTSQAIVELELSSGRDVVLEIDVQGAALVKEKLPEAIGIFILPPSFEILRERLIGRGTDEDESLQTRLKNARGEVERYKEFDFIVINDSIEIATTQLASIFYADRARRERQEELANLILKSFTK